MSFWISIIAVVLSVLIGGYQIFSGRPEAMKKHFGPGGGGMSSFEASLREGSGGDPTGHPVVTEEPSR